MAIRDESGEHSLAPSAVPAARTNGTVNGTGVDTSGYDAVTCYVNAGLWTDGTHALKVQDSDDNSSFADLVSPAALIGTLTSITTAPTGSKNLEAAVINARRYVRLVITTSGATTGAVVGGGFLLGKPGMAPVA